MPKRPEISVVVPAVNEERYIGYMFEGLSRQVFRNFEVIVVDGNSTDKTRDIARANGAKVIIEKRRGIGRARNVGAMTARGRIIVFIDADTKPSPTFL
ncbi:MAG: glycosyltransferase family 2 protein, partial [Candidatus Marsarchaeota archaeon]|nr:glycosyltransferase family 2 protein [Candidatus Marsarchaeota archaeon]